MKKIYSLQVTQKIIFTTLMLTAVTFTATSIANPSQYLKNTTLLTLKLYSEPHEKDRKSTYTIILPEGASYSYYVGGDLPTWHYVDDRIVQGEFHSVSLVTIKVHPQKTPANKTKSQSIATLTILDPENARVIWQGKINYGAKSIAVNPGIANQKYYEMKVHNTPENTVWFEITDKQ
jgi:hypothetical protein